MNIWRRKDKEKPIFVMLYPDDEVEYDAVNHDLWLTDEGLDRLERAIQDFRSAAMLAEFGRPVGQLVF